MDIAVVVIAYNRRTALNRLLCCLADSFYGKERVCLYVSIDDALGNDCLDVARKFTWQHGPKEIIEHREHLGLKKHVITATDLVMHHDALIVLEDDLVVSPYFYQFAKWALVHVRDNDLIAGIGLYSYSFNELVGFPFGTICDGYDNYYSKVPCSWGQLFSKEQWLGFKKCYDSGILKFDDSEFIPSKVKSWSDTNSWKKFMYLYTYINEKYFMYPNVAYTSNCGERGTNRESRGRHLVSRLNLKSDQWKFAGIEETVNVYDQFFEIEKTDKLRESLRSDIEDIEIDLYGQKPKEYMREDAWLLSSKETKEYEHSLPFFFVPQQANLLMKDYRYGEVGAHFRLSTNTGFSDQLNENYINRVIDLQSPRIAKEIRRRAIIEFKKKSKRYRFGDMVASWLSKGSGRRK